MRVDTALLLAAALVTSPVSAIAKNEVPRKSSPPYAISNSSSIVTQPSPISSSTLSVTSLTSSLLTSSTDSSSSIPISPSTTSPTTPPTSSPATTSTTSSAISSTTSPTSSSSDPPTTSQTSSTSSSVARSAKSRPTTTKRKTTERTTSHDPLATQISSSNTTSTTGSNSTTIPTKITTGHNSTSNKNGTSDLPPLPSNLPPGYTLTRLPCNSTATRIPSRNGTSPHGQPRCKNGSSISIVPACTPLPLAKTFTRYLVVHTSTVTFSGRRSDYRPPFAPISTPNYCDPNLYPAVPRPVTSGRMTFGFMGTMSMVTETFTIEGLPLTAEFPLPLQTAIARVPVTTFITTDKNPSVVFPSDPIPDYSQTWSPGGSNDGSHTPVGGGGAPAPDSVAPVYIVTAGPTAVVINTQTFTVLPGSSSTVTLEDGGVFTIGSTAIVGQGSTIARPPSVTASGPSSSILDGIPVTSAGLSLEISGGTFPIPSSDSNTVTVNGKAVTISPTGITIGGYSMAYTRPAASDVVVAGGEMLTAVGRSVVVLHSVTYTYGSGIAPIVQVINGDTVTIGPTGVFVHGTTLGGVSAEPTDTDYEIVGGATIAKLPPSMVVVNGETYAVGPGASLKTVVIGDQTLTMGPIGLVMAATTLKYPFDPSVTTTIAGRATGESMPQETGKEEEDAAYSLRPDIRVGLTCLCIAFGVLALG